jgi:DNA-nicking Smr family endonuclease
MDDGFADNPFRRLDRDRFPDAAKAAGDVKLRHAGRSTSPSAKRPDVRSKARDGASPRRKAAADPPSETEDEAEIFASAMGKVHPLAGGGRSIIPPPAPKTPPSPEEPPFGEALEQTPEFALTFSDEYMEGHVLGLDKGILSQLHAGTLSPEGHLDLHGLNAMQAFIALRDFMKGAWYKGQRTILVVTGRGRNSPHGQGILREKLQHWLTQDPFKRVLLAYCTARACDGGPGSVYVLLRKYRKKGKIRWDRIPADDELF